MKKNIPTIASFIVIATILYFLFNVMKPFFMMIFVAFVISIVMNPIFNYFRNTLKRGKILSSALTLLLFIIFIFLPVMAFTFLIVSEMRHLIQFLHTQNVTEIEQVLQTTLHQYGIPYEQIQINIKELALTFLAFLSQNATGIITQTGTFLGNAVFTLLICFYMFIEKERIVDYIKSINPLEKHHANTLYQHAIRIINRTIKGNLVLMILQWIIGTTGLVIFGSIAPILLGLLYGIFSIIPTLGAFFIWIPVSIYLFFHQGMIYAIGFLLWSVLSTFLVEEYIAPRLIDEDTHVHPLLIVMSVAGAIEYFGLIGMLIGPTIITLSYVALQIYKEIVDPKATKVSKSHRNT